jgi:hypothetical protein
MLILGADPGQSGGIAVLDRTGRLLCAEAMPVLRGAVPTVDVRALGLLLRCIDDHECYAYVERAQAMPRQGASSGFNYGVIFGSLLTALHTEGIGYELVQALHWKKGMNLHSDKRGSLALCRQMYPALDLKRKDDGIAEAILIARWGLRQQGGAQ